MSPTIEERAQRIVELLQDKKALDILLMDLRPLTDTTDFFILCSGTSDQHVKTLADELIDRLKAAGDPPWHVEGYGTRRWVLVDCVDIVVHIFQRETREFYALERLWGDAETTSFEETSWQEETSVREAGGDLVFSRS